MLSVAGSVGLFLGAFKAQSRAIVPAMLIAAARAIAGAARGDDLVPSVLDRAVHTAVAQAVEAKAEELGLRQTLVVDDAWTRGKAEPLPFSR